MELYQEIITHAFADFQVHTERITELYCYKILEQIKAIIADDSLDDVHCFYKIEEIVCVLEDHGISCGGRHDF